jgi:membrane-associated protease RseP (regulator of RpoE activity)
MWKLICLAFLCWLPGSLAQAQELPDDYVTGMTVVGKPGSGSSCPPIVAEFKPDTPAAKAGIQPGDRLIAVDGHHETEIMQWRPLLRTKDSKPSTIELEGEHGPYSVTVGRIKASVLWEREGWKLLPNGLVFPKNATEAEMQRVSKMHGEPPVSEKVFPVAHYPANLELYYPGFEIFVWKEPEPMTVGGIEDGPAEKAGVHYGDAIVSVNGVNPRGKPITELEQLFSSSKPATMRLVIDRGGAINTFTFELAKASDVARANHRRMYEGTWIPAATPPAYLHCLSRSRSIARQFLRGVIAAEIRRSRKFGS